MDNNQNQFGAAPTYSGDTKDKVKFVKRYRLKAPEQGKEEFEFECRILPPMKSLANNQHGWKHFHSVHWGLRKENTEKPGETSLHPFGCVKVTDFKTKAVRVACAKCTEYDINLAEKDRRVKELLTEGKTKDEIKVELEPLNDWLLANNCDRNWYMAVILPDGEEALLMIRHKTMNERLMPLLKKLEKRKVNALDLKKGVWLKFTRRGRGRESSDDVREVMEEITLPNGVTAEVMKTSELTDTQIAHALEVLPDLTTVVPYYSPETVSKLTKTNGDPEEVSKILGEATKTTKEAAKSVSMSTPPQENKLSEEEFFQKYSQKSS